MYWRVDLAHNIIVSYPEITIDACEMDFRVKMCKNVFEKVVLFITIE